MSSLTRTTSRLAPAAAVTSRAAASGRRARASSQQGGQGDQGGDEAEAAELGDGPHGGGEPADAVVGQPGRHRAVAGGQLVALEDVFGDGAEQPAEADHGRQAHGQRQPQGALGAEPAGEEAELGAIAAAQRRHCGPFQLAGEQGADLVGVAGDPAGSGQHPADKCQQGQQDQAGLAGQVGDPLVGAAGQVAEQHEPGCPDEAAGHGPDQEGPVRHSGHAGGGGHQRPQQPDEAADEDRLPAPGGQHRLDAVPAGRSDAAAQRTGPQRRTQAPAGLIADQVAGHRTPRRRRRPCRPG